MRPDEIVLHPVIRGLAEKFEDIDWSEPHGQDVAHVPADLWKAFAEEAQKSGFDFCSDVTAVDWMRQRSDRFEVVANLLSMKHGLRLRMSTTLSRENPTVDSLTPLWPGAGFAEREVYDMFGIIFVGHPDLTRILMPEDWDGYPLRKDYAVGAVPVQFKEAEDADEDSAFRAGVRSESR